MHYVTKIQTFDGTLHETKKDALRHLDRLYGDAMTRICHQICSLDGKYRSITTWVDENLDVFKPLIRIKADMEMHGDDPEDNDTED